MFQTIGIVFEREVLWSKIWWCFWNTSCYFILLIYRSLKIHQFLHLLTRYSPPPNETNEILRTSVNLITSWRKKWKIEINKTKSTHIKFTNKIVIKYIAMKNNIIPIKNEVKCLGLHFDSRRHGVNILQLKKKQLNIKVRQMFWILGRKSNLTLTRCYSINRY